MTIYQTRHRTRVGRHRMPSTFELIIDAVRKLFSL